MPNIHPALSMLLAPAIRPSKSTAPPSSPSLSGSTDKWPFQGLAPTSAELPGPPSKLAVDAVIAAQPQVTDGNTAQLARRSTPVADDTTKAHVGGVPHMLSGAVTGSTLGSSNAVQSRSSAGELPDPAAPASPHRHVSTKSHACAPAAGAVLGGQDGASTVSKPRDVGHLARARMLQEYHCSFGEQVRWRGLV